PVARAFLELGAFVLRGCRGPVRAVARLRAPGRILLSPASFRDRHRLPRAPALARAAPPRGLVPRFYLDAALRAGSSVLLPEDSAHHAVHVLRVHAGDEITLFNGRGGEYAGRIASIQRLKVLVDVLAHQAVERESPLRMVLVQGVSAGERMDFTVRKSVELGVAEIRPVLAAASVARPKE